MSTSPKFFRTKAGIHYFALFTHYFTPLDKTMQDMIYLKSQGLVWLDNGPHRVQKTSTLALLVGVQIAGFKGSSPAYYREFPKVLHVWPGKITATTNRTLRGARGLQHTLPAINPPDSVPGRTPASSSSGKTFSFITTFSAYLCYFIVS